jgi:diguanylate cyclase (GGDEF)-like protein
MLEQDPSTTASPPTLASSLEDLRNAVDADGGAALYVDDGDGALRLEASVGNVAVTPSSLIRRMRGNGKGKGHANGKGDVNSEPYGPDLVLKTPDGTSVVVLARRNGKDFSQQDRTVAILYLRRFADQTTVPTATTQPRQSGWTRQLEAIQRIAARLTRLASVEEVGATICNETRQVIDYDEAQVLVGSVASGGLRLVAAARGVKGSNERVTILPRSGPAAQAIGRAAIGGLPVLASALPDLGPDRPGPHSMLVVPLHFESRVTGVICLIAEGAGNFDQDDLRLLQILGDQAAVAIENARLLSGRDEAVHELAALLAVSEAASAAADETELAGLLSDRMRRATKTDAAIISRWDAGSTVLRELWRDGIPDPEEPVDVADSSLRRGVLRDGRPIVIHADSGEPSPEVVQLRLTGGRTLIVLPLNAGGRTIGMVELITFKAKRNLSEAELKAAEAMASLAATGLEKVRLLEQLRNAADVDLVTGVHNHRYLQERLRQEVSRSARSHSPFAVLMLDLDNFKPVNDRHGHADGDRVLHNIGATIKDYVRTSDVVARYGGDEYVVLMPDTPVEHADLVAQRVVAGIVSGRHEMSDGTVVSVGVSAGLAIYPRDGRTSAQLLQAADTAMYNAKRGGGRQLERSGTPMTIDLVPAPAAG